MTVFEILKLVSSLSVGLDEPTESDFAIFLRYLNLVHFELFRRTASFNEDLQTKVESLDVVDGVAPATANPPFAIKNVFLPNQNVRLDKTSFSKVVQYDPGVQNAGYPRKWYYHNGVINIYPKATQQISVVYLANPEPFTLYTTGDQIPYPPFFHQVLVDGTCYYLFQDEAGFNNPIKMAECKNRYDRGQAEMINYLMLLSSDPNLSTYLDV